MRLGANKPAHYEYGPNLTPMVDVVLVILIFLMLVAQFIGNDFYLQQQSGVLEQGTQVVESGDRPLDHKITVKVTLAEGRVIATIDGKNVADIESIRQVLLDRRRMFQREGLMPGDEEAKTAGADRDRITIAIEPAGNVKHKDYFAVYDAALRAGFRKVTFTVPR